MSILISLTSSSTPSIRMRPVSPSNHREDFAS
jgi:hypothetical protein